MLCACLVFSVLLSSLFQCRVVNCALAPGWSGVVIVVLVIVVEEVVELVVVVPTNSRVEWHLDRAVSPRQMS